MTDEKFAAVERVMMLVAVSLLVMAAVLSVLALPRQPSAMMLSATADLLTDTDTAPAD